MNMKFDENGDKVVGEVIYESLHEIYNTVFGPKVSVIIPAYNEAKTIRTVIEAAKSSKFVNEVVVVDDGSVDGTCEKIRKMDVKMVRHEKNKGKGAAMKTGLNAASGSIILFLDADLKNITSKKISMMLRPIINDEADFVKSYFSSYKHKKLSRSQLLYRPLLKYMFQNLNPVHPVSGQYAARRPFFEKINFMDDYGIDISIIIDAAKHNLRIKEVCIGTLSHKNKKTSDIEKINDDIIRTIVKKYDVEKSGN